MSKNKYREFDTEEADIKRAIESLSKLVEKADSKENEDNDSGRVNRETETVGSES